MSVDGSDRSVRTQSPLVGLFRCGAALVAGVATFYFGGWMGGALLSMLLASELALFLSFLASLVLAVFAARLVWTRSAAISRGRGAGILESAAAGALLVGGIAFCAGFFGPIIFAPDANQGPLLGLFITGPLGVVAGAIGGCVHGIRRRGR